MASEEIGFRELRALVRRSWKLVLACALLPPIALFVYLNFVAPDTYSATASLLIQDLAEAERSTGSVDVYKALLASDSILDETRRRLVAAGSLGENDQLLMGRNLLLVVDEAPNRLSLLAARQVDQMAVIRLQALDQDPQTAAAVANAWAEVFIERSRPMTRSSISSRQPVLDDELPGIRQQIEKVETERVRVAEEYAGRLSRIVQQFQQREEATSTDWDQRIAAAETKAGTATAEYHAETRRLMEAVVDRFSAEAPAEGEPSVALRPKLLEIVSVRAELAKSPRVLRLEKAASDETLAELMVVGGDAERLDNTLVTQEINPLYDQLAVTLLDLEGELKRLAGALLAEVSKTLGELEQIQLTRAAGLAALTGEGRLEPRSLHRQRSFALRTLARARKDALDEVEAQRAMAFQEIKRRHDQLVDLEQRLKQELNTAVLAGLFEEVETVSLASRAVPSSVPEPRQSLVLVAVAAFLGGVLGLMIALFRSAERSTA